MTDKLYGWRGKVLWVDLAAKTSKELDISDLCKDYLGARGIASKLAWKYLKPGTGAFDDGNLLMFFNGPCTGTLVPGTGKGYVFGVGPQTYPEHFTRSSMGGRWANGLKACGYDGFILENKCSDKVILEVTEKGVEFHDAIRYWGHDTQNTQYMLQEEFGEEITDSFVIGPAGENLVRFATIHTLFSNVSGQGGFGAVMGDKKVKAILFNGSIPVPVPDLGKIMEVRQQVLDIEPYEKGPLAEPESAGFMANTQLNVKELKARGDTSELSLGVNPCPGCGLGGVLCGGGAPVLWHYKHVPPTNSTVDMNGMMKCVEVMAWGWNAETKQESQWITAGTGRNYRWPANFRAGTEIMNMGNFYGLNSWEVCSYMMWFSELETIGVDVSKLIGMDYNVDDDTLWQRILIKIIKREGFGSDMAEGIARLGEKLGSPYKEYSTHAMNGYCDHALGTHCYINLQYPYWIVNALLTATDVRDPLSDSGHRYFELTGMSFTDDNAGSAYDRIAKELWGSELAVGPKAELRKVNGGTMADDEFDDLAYTWKEQPAIQIQNRSVVIGSGVFCDGVYPRYRSDGSKKFKNGDPIGDFDIEAKIMTAVTGIDYTTKKLEEIGERIINIQRCYNVLEFNRNKAFDMTICDNIQPRGDWTTGKRIDKDRFSALLGRYYALRGWDENGIPTEEKLLELGLDECNEKMKAYR